MAGRGFIFILAAIFLLVGCGRAQQTEKSPDSTLTSPNGEITVEVSLDQMGQAQYQIQRLGEPVLLSSALGMDLSDAQFSENLKLSEISYVTLVEDQYSMLQGKRLDIQYRANEKRFSFVNAQGDKMGVIFRASNDGIAFRYHFPGQSNEPSQVVAEASSFRFPNKTRAWLQQMQVVNTGWEGTNPAYEEHYQMDVPAGTPAPTEAGWVFPALFRTGDSWVLLSEVGMQSNFHGSRLAPDSAGGEYRVGFPMPGEVFTGGELLAKATRPFSSPWRTITLGSLATVVDSTMGTDLAEPAIKMNTDFIKPGMASWSWGLLKDDSVVYEVQKDFIDYAADMGWEYALVDVNWDQNIGYERMQELVDYGKSKNVGLFLWYNSSGDWNTSPYTPKSQLLTRAERRAEFARLRDMGVSGVKIDFFPGDGRSSMAYYRDILQDAADFQLMVNHHGSTLPRGIQRTFPNMMTMESVHGMEMVTFFQDTADLEASHAAMLPFARNVFDPMDYTPTVFHDLKNPAVERRTTNGFQLALPVIFLSGIQHIVETPEGMATVPDYVRDFMREVPVVWDESRFIEGYPGKLAVFARRKGDTWYLAGINGEQEAKQLTLDLSFVGDKSGTLITDGEAPRSFVRESVAAGEVSVELKPAGGFVIVFQNER